ncbi:MAG: cyclic pyranopterin monophosphate synthase MoaC [Cyclobacteriaceae bacterium]|nr:cyclic pyranopterin monophosphate synthase MoaC [Cyclobacteriaceae bacterium]
MKNRLSHVGRSGDPRMVDVSEKKITKRVAVAQATVRLGKKILKEIKDNELNTRKGPVFQTALLAGVMGAKKTSELIPLCHPLGLEDCQLKFDIKKDCVVIEASATLMGKTGVEMEALTAVSIAALTVYDMCKALSHDIVIDNIRLLKKTGGKKDFHRK